MKFSFFVFVSDIPFRSRDLRLISAIKQHDNRVDATVDSARIIASLCIRSGTVRRLIYTASVLAASPLKEDGSGYKEFMDETCWTPLDFSNPYSNTFLQVDDFLHKLL